MLRFSTLLAEIGLEDFTFAGLRPRGVEDDFLSTSAVPILTPNLSHVRSKTFFKKRKVSSEQRCRSLSIAERHLNCGFGFCRQDSGREG